ncbi:MAG: L,D-transpeptidase [Pseudanabaena sp.]|jgi:lipoprotein-anchoring transpeptidase ErfK/SrfK|nr:L,D-transpeptidase [Pseudanabaena sp. M090S1SP2A07QC]MCA6505932.1 L,D-transpeptidase [Pseudanabaena sp. M172S2SP2A07QC]MCA6508512.1 L,D-transpeptidase [Pseudanabaena sp. M109S1SP2A07QC]MCA6517923.1 L,D-transpeptidase [Pseudanabaena sp. M110S1SP2A07QC]MCA6522480.1 L,D-transpeptidase [Pseudanabaena sp. M051S1SP2A07QC]MCA6525562.1 L,D-transpeptidase [Pseudanabaena sp. M179S2SP2A07QC]MCA6530012.1 L,D-transpeptidase [Pseudanabaena sp. M125S2SP2A07QC]MCA6532951.1 L,D-transpeptidase [Pseudanabae
MIKYWKARSTALVTALLLTGLSGGINSINLDRAIAQTTSRTIRSQDIEKLRRSGQRWIEIRLRSQRLLAWQGNQLVYAVVVSTGKSATPTPTGLFNVQSKYPTGRMQGEDYNVPDVPYIMYYSGNYAIHGAYWHRSFGIPISHGCTNVAPDHAAWLYRWASVGTPVVVR